jgi:hypothetical protein
MLALALSARGDTLSLRGGTAVAGSWVGADAGQIRFLVNDQIQTYSRLDVLVVTFGNEASKVQDVPKSVTTAPPAPISIGESIADVVSAFGQPNTIATLGSRTIYFYNDMKVTFVDGKVAEFHAAAASGVEPVAGPSTGNVAGPELIDTVYLQSASGKLVPLMRIEGQLKKPWTNPLAVEPTKPTLEFKPAPSTVRVVSGQKLVFVVELANGVDPGSFSLLVLKIAKIRKMSPQRPIHFNIAKFGESSYALTPTTDLAPGEYGFKRQGSNDLYCFGVDDEANASGAEGSKNSEK